MNQPGTNGGAIERAAGNVYWTNIGRGAAVVTLLLVSYLAKAIIEVQSDVKVLNATIALGMADRYRGSDAARDFKLRDLEIDTMKSRITEIERIVRK